MKGRKSGYVNERMLLISVQKCACLRVCVFEKVPTSESRSFSEISYWNKRTDVGKKIDFRGVVALFVSKYKETSIFKQT